MKTKTPVDKKKLLKIVFNLEKSNTFPNRNELYKQCAFIYNNDEEYSNHITHSIVMLRLIEWGYKIKTKKGKLKPPSKGSGKTSRKSAKERLMSLPVATTAITALRKSIPLKYNNVLKKLEKGSVTAAVKAKCLECSGWQSVEVKNCPILDCPLYLFRPYK